MPPAVMRGGHCGGIQGLAAEDESGAHRERQGIKGTSDALWRVLHSLRWKADCRASDQRHEVQEHHEEAGLRVTLTSEEYLKLELK